MILEKDSKDSIALASSCLKNGGIAILPTDTVYGFSGIVDVRGEKDLKTDEKIRLIKGRAEDKPLIQLIASPSDIFLYTKQQVPEKLLSKWPGPLTIIVKIKEDSQLSTSLTSIAFRCPGDLWLRKVIAECGRPIYSTSVNRSGFPVLQDFEEIKKEFEAEVDMIVSGTCTGGQPSTIVSLQSDGTIKILRQGSLVL